MSGFKRRGKNNPEPQKAVLYTDLSIPLDRFIACLIKSELQQLIISGNPTETEIAQAWASIYSQYIDLNYENETIYILQLQKEIRLLSSHVMETETCLNFLAVIYDQDLVDILRNNGYKEKFASVDPDKYAADIISIRNKLAPKKLTLSGKELEHDKYVEDKKDDNVDEKYFMKMLVRLAKHQGVGMLRAKELTVEEFIYLMKDYTEFIIAHNKEIEDGSKGQN